MLSRLAASPLSPRHCPQCCPSVPLLRSCVFHESLRHPSVAPSSLERRPSETPFNTVLLASNQVPTYYFSKSILESYGHFAMIGMAQGLTAVMFLLHYTVTKETALLVRSAMRLSGMRSCALAICPTRATAVPELLHRKPAARTASSDSAMMDKLGAAQRPAPALHPPVCLPFRCWRYRCRWRSAGVLVCWRQPKP